MGLRLISLGLLRMTFAGGLAAGGALPRAVCGLLPVLFTLRPIAGIFTRNVRYDANFPPEFSALPHWQPASQYIVFRWQPSGMFC